MVWPGHSNRRSVNFSSKLPRLQFSDRAGRNSKLQPTSLMFCLERGGGGGGGAAVLGISPFNKIFPVPGLYFYLSDLIFQLATHAKRWLCSLVQDLSGVASVRPARLLSTAPPSRQICSAFLRPGRRTRQQLNQNKFHSLRVWLDLVLISWLATFRPLETYPWTSDMLDALCLLGRSKKNWRSTLSLCKKLWSFESMTEPWRILACNMLIQLTQRRSLLCVRFFLIWRKKKIETIYQLNSSLRIPYFILAFSPNVFTVKRK